MTRVAAGALIQSAERPVDKAGREDQVICRSTIFA